MIDGSVGTDFYLRRTDVAADDRTTAAYERVLRFAGALPTLPVGSAVDLPQHGRAYVAGYRLEVLDDGEAAIIACYLSRARVVGVVTGS